MSQTYKLSPKQKQGIVLLKNKTKKYYLFDGGARSGKTFLIARYLIIRACKYPNTSHMIGRYRFNHAKVSIWMQTLLPLLKTMLPNGGYTVNKTDFMVEFTNGSIIMLAGFDDSDRTEKILGQEYATIFVNEATQISYDTFQMLKSRLNWQGIDLKFILDCNPRNPAHWLHRLFISGVDPVSKVKINNAIYARLQFSPYDNAANLNENYIKDNLETLTGVKKRRLLDGVWCDSGQGTVYNFNREINVVEKNIEYIDQFPVWVGIDFGIASDVFMIFFQIISVAITEKNKKGLIIQIISEYVNNNQDYKHYTNIIKNKRYANIIVVGDPAGRARDAKLESWFTLFQQEGIRMLSPRKYSVADMIDNANQYVPYVKCNETLTPRTVEMFENWAYPKDKDDKIIENALPEHDEYSHPGTAFYYAITEAFPLKNSAGVQNIS